MADGSAMRMEEGGRGIPQKRFDSNSPTHNGGGQGISVKNVPL